MAKAREAFRTISEVADWLGVQTHVLRFWESKFSQVKPVKRAGGRRYYRPTDMQLLGGIKRLLHDDGMTIKGVQKILKEKGVKEVSSFCQLALDGEDSAAAKAIASPQTAKKDAAIPPDVPDDEGAEIARKPAREILENKVMGGTKPAEADTSDQGVGAPQAVPTPQSPKSDGALPSFMRPARETTVPPPVSPPPLAEPPAAPGLSIKSVSVTSPSIPPAPEPAAVVHRPWPDQGLPLAQALRKLETGQIPVDQLRPLYERCRDLRRRMADQAL